ncbi:MAG: MFS transporter [Nocardioides sp.]
MSLGTHRAESSPDRTESLLSRRYVLATIGSFAIIFLAAYESLALTTVMPTISRALDGEQWYALSFAAPLATAVVGMVAAGQWSDHSGPAGPLVASLVSFGSSLVVCAEAPTMEIFVAGRLLQGLGAGGCVVALYVLVGVIYPAALQPRIFAAFAIAWILPSLIGPPIAAGIATQWGWPWVFWSVLVLTAAALVLTWPAVREIRRTDPPALGWIWSRLAWAGLAAIGVLALDLLGSRAELAAVALVTVGIALAARPLLPAKTMRAAHGLPAIVATRGLLAAAFFTAEAYVPYALQDNWTFSPAQAGAALTVAGIAWASGSQIQARLGDRLPHRRALLIGSGLLAGGNAMIVLAAAPLDDWVVLIVGYGMASAGMGIAYPRTSVAMLDHSTARNRGFNSAALTIADSLAGAVAITFGGIAFRTAQQREWGDPFAADFLVAAAAAVAAVLAAGRVVARSPAPPPG